MISALCGASRQPRPNALAFAEQRRSPMRFLSFIGVLAIVVGVAAAVYFFGGFYTVAATQPDHVVVDWALKTVRTASVSRHATERVPATLDDPAVGQAGG